MAEKLDMQEGVKPISGAPSNFGQGGTIRKLDEKGRIVDVRTSGAPLDTANVKTAEEFSSPVRMGDYYFAPTGEIKVWENSPTDLLQKYKVAIGGTEKPQETVSLANEGLGIAGGAAIGSIVPGVGTAVGALIGGLAGGLVAHNTAAEEALNNWRNQDVKYDTAVEFYRDDNGQLKYKLDYQKMGAGGARSGEGVKEAQNRETKVALGDDGRLKVTVSPIFATTARFQEMMDFISENYGGLSKDTENLDEILTEIKNGIDGETRSYVTNMRLYADYANRFPNATPESIVSGYVTEASGYADPTKMSDYQVTVLDDNNNSQTKSAKDFFDSVLAKSKDDRNRLVEKLSNIVYGEGDYDDNQKAIAYGEMQALFAASANTEGYENDKYQGMMDADFIVTVISRFAPLGLNVGDAIRFISGGNLMNTNQEYLNSNDFAIFLGGIASIGAGFGLWKGGMKGTEALLKLLPGTSQLFQASLSGMGQAAAKIEIAKNGASAAVRIGLAEGAFKILKVGTFDAALAGAQTLVSGEDFWANFGQDFVRDAALEAIFSYYDMIAFQKYVDSGTVYVYVDKQTGNIKKSDVYQGEAIDSYIYDDGLLTDTTYEYAAKTFSDVSAEGDVVGVIQTASGSTVEVINGKIKYTPAGGKVLEGEAVPADGLPKMATGVVSTEQSSSTTLTKSAVEESGLSSEEEVFTMSTTSADAAIVAGKIASLQGSKVGLSLYKNLFNKNAVLDVVNNIALAKTGDQNSWREAQENFVDVTDNAQRELQNIQNGVYLKEAAEEWAKTLEVMGGFNYQYKYRPKTDGAYINAINQLQRAQLLNESRPEGDTTDYVAKAVEKYGEVLASMPPDRAEMLQSWLEQGKKWIAVFNKSALKSGKIEPKALENMMESDIQSDIGYFPVWAKKKTYNGLLNSFYGISQKRNPFKEWLRDGEWVPLKELDDPFNAMTRYTSAVATNMGLNDMVESAATVLDKADLLVDNTPTSATIRKQKLDSIKNKDELKKKLDELVEAKKKEVKEKTLTPKQYKENMVELYEQSAIPEIATALSGINIPKNWDEFWKNAPAQTRKDIRNELERTSLQTGYGISDTRARLNAQVPGFDVIDWSLLGRQYVNGLAPEIGYAWSDGEVKMYIMDLEDLKKLTGLTDETNMLRHSVQKIREDINTEDGEAVLPLHLDRGHFSLKKRWGHNKDHNDDWQAYLNYLGSIKGITKVPVAVEQGPLGFDTFDYLTESGIAENGLRKIVDEIDKSIATGKAPKFSPREISAASYAPGYNPFKIHDKIRHGIPSLELFSEEEWADLANKALQYDWSSDPELKKFLNSKGINSVIKERLGKQPQDITSEVQQAFREYGRIPLYHNQNDPLGSIEANNKEKVPTTREGKLFGNNGAGDALWLAPNASYTDGYGKNKVIGTIPVKYFMSDKEKRGIIDRLRKEAVRLETETEDEVGERYFPLANWFTAEVMKGATPETKKIKKEYEDNLITSGETAIVLANEFIKNGSPAQKKKGAELKALLSHIDSPYGGDIPSELFDILPKNAFWKKIKRLSEIKTMVDALPYDPMSGNYHDQINSYRALAEYTGKPIIDISDDGWADGTAYFYYKEVNPEFDKEIGKQLEIQAAGTPVWPQELKDEAFDDWAINTTMGKFIDYITDKTDLTDVFGQDGEDIKKMLRGEMEIPKGYKDILLRENAINQWEKDNMKEAALKSMYTNRRIRDKVSKAVDLVRIEDVAMATLIDVVFDAYLGTSKSSYDLAEGKNALDTIILDVITHEDIFSNDLDWMLKALEIENPDYITPEEKAAWDAINPRNIENVPTEPQFNQPHKVSYEDFQKGAQVDKSMVKRIQDSYRSALGARLIREASRVTGLAEDYLSPYAWGFDVESYLNTGLIPDLQMALNKKMLPGEFNSFVQARMEQAIRDAAPYQSPEMVLKSQLENVAQDWHDWAVKHIKAGRASSKELTEFAGTHNLDLPKDKRPIGPKIKHALWEMVQDGKTLPKIEGLDKKTISKSMEKESFYALLDSTPLFQSAVKDKNELVDLVASEINGDTVDAYEMGAAAKAVGMGGRYPITWYKNGKPYTRLIKYDTEEHKRWAEEITSLLYDKEIVKKAGIIDRVASGVANDFRLLTTGWDPSRVLPNITRDTPRSFVVGPRFIQAKKTLQAAIEMGNYTPKQKENLMKAIENAAESAKNASYNSAYRTPKQKQVAITKEYLSKTGEHPLKRFWYNMRHDKRSIAEFPMEFFEGFSRRQNALSLAAVQLGKDQRAGKSYKEQLKNAVTAANFAGREYTANFQRKGKLIGRTSKYIAYQSSAYAGLDGMMRAFIDNPKLVSRNFAVFVIAYLLLLGDTLSREETRRQYYRLSEYDRENQIVIGMGDSILTIPMDQELAGLLFPYRRIMETLNGVDPVSFFEFVWGTLTEAMPMDLSGFSEDGGFNLSRGLEKLTSQNMPNVITPIQEASTGYDLYYGSDLSVSKETLKDYGILSPEPGDYTTTGKDSAFLRNIANATGIPQWQLQVMWEDYGGNIGKYALNIIDKASGATKEQQGGKDFANTVFNSFTALDQDAAASRFYDGMKQLRVEKGKLLQKIANYNEDLKIASGDAKVELQNKIQKAKEEYGTKVGDFVDQYINAYDITGGLPKSYAQQVYYLFRLDDDDTVYESGSVEEYYNNQAKQQLKQQATALSAPILDKYYNNRIGNIYQDTDGVWRRYLSGGAQTMRNSIYGQGEQQKVDLLNILEGKDSKLVEYRKAIKNAREKAYEAKDWDTYDSLGYALDQKVVEAISPYIEKYGAENVLGNTQVLDYLSDWFIVPDSFKKTKRGGYVSLSRNASSQEAFVQPYIKYIFGLPTNYYSYSESKLTAPLIGGEGE